MRYVDKLLARREHIVRIARDHWITLLPATLVDGILGVVIVGLSVLGVVLSPPWTWFGLLFLFVPIGHLTFCIINWWSKQYVVTNRRIIQIAGTVNKHVSDTLLEKINDIVTEQSALGQMLNFGDIQIISGSESGIDIFRRFPDPIGLKKDMLEQKALLVGVAETTDEAGEQLLSADDVPGLIAELDELRKKGVLTDAEFEEKKHQLLGRI